MIRRTLKHLNNIRNHSRRFGWRAALDIARALDYQHPNTIVEVRFPGVSLPIRMRSGTTDTEVFCDVFLREQYRNDWNLNPNFILDCGAHIGLASIYFARKYPSAAILSVEPSQANFSLLQQNVHPYPQVSVRNAAVWHTTGFVSIENPSDDPWGFRCSMGYGANVPALTVSDLAEGRTIDILKMDIEGAEKAIFSSPNLSWLERVRVLMIELHDRFQPGCAESVYRALPSGFNQAIAGETISLKVR